MVSIAKTLKNNKLTRIASVISKANNIDAQMVKSFKRKCKEHEINFATVKRHKATMGRLGNPRTATQRDPPSYQHQGVKQGWTDLIATSPVTCQSFELGHGNVTVASSGGGGSQLHTTTTKSYNPDTLLCLVCTGAREGHHILGNFEGNGITIMLGDQQMPAMISIESSSCVIAMLPALKSFAQFNSK
jgi:ribosomal protein L7Ae-like RNA K-turn-binding protein